MRDRIRRQDAIEAINAVFPVDPMKSEYAQGIACGAALAKTYIEQLPSAERKGKCDIEKALKLLSQQLIWMYDDGEISYKVCIELSGKLMDIANMVRGEGDEQIR